MKARSGLIAALWLLGVLTVHAQTAGWSYGWSTSFMGEKYSQCLSPDEGVPYPEWNPGDSVCPLHPTNAVSLATQAASKAFPDVKAWELFSMSLHMNPGAASSGIWFYEVTLRPDFGNAEKKPITCVSILVGLDGHVPDITKDGTTKNMSYSERIQRRRDELLKKKNEPPPAPPPQEKTNP